MMEKVEKVTLAIGFFLIVVFALPMFFTAFSWSSDSREQEAALAPANSKLVTSERNLTGTRPGYNFTLPWVTSEDKTCTQSGTWKNKSPKLVGTSECN